jgi:ribosome maturation factor RimP
MSTLREIIESVLMRQGIDLEELKQTKAGSRSMVKITVDGDGASGGGLDLDEVAHVSRQISEALDETGVMGETAYVLEVGTRGVEAPLTKPTHWKRNISRLVTITTNDGSTLTSRIVDATSDKVTVETGETLAYSTIKKAIIQVEMHRDNNETKE